MYLTFRLSINRLKRSNTKYQHKMVMIQHLLPHSTTFHIYVYLYFDEGQTFNNSWWISQKEEMNLKNIVA